MKNLFNRFKDQFVKEESGFAITQILIISIGLAIGITSLLSSSIIRLSTSKIKTLENNSRNSTHAAITNLRSLFNNTKGPYNYFWLSKVCSSNVSNYIEECPSFNSYRERKIYPGMLMQGKFPDLSNIYWTDSFNKWCQGESRCFGRQVAPSCTYSGKINGTPINWINTTNRLQFIIDKTEEKVGRNIPNVIKDSNQSYLVKSINYVGKEHGGENTIVVEGFTRSAKGNQNISSSNKARVSMAVNKVVPDSGFAFISAGENEKDRYKSLYLGNLSVEKDKQGSILWRTNVYNNSNCTQMLSKANVLRPAQLPDNAKSMGGLWVQPLELPSEPEHGQNSSGSKKQPQHNLSSVFCSPSNWRDRSSKCTDLDNLSRGGTNNGKILIDNLFVQGDGAIFSITTNESNRATLVFNGDIEISNKGKFCHRHNPGGACGSGKPENLTIIFNQKNIAKQEVFCDPKGGMTLANGFNNANYTFVLSSTGSSTSEKFSAFVYGPETTITTARLDNDYYQEPNSNTRQLVITRGAFGVIDNPHGSDPSQKVPKVIRFGGRRISFSNERSPNSSVDLQGWKIIAVGNIQGGYQIPSNKPMDTMVLIWHPDYNYYVLFGLDYSNQDYVEIKTTSQNGKTARIDLARNLNARNSNGDRWLDYYGIKLKEATNNNPVRVNGVAWMKNVCFDKGLVKWDFDKKTPVEIQKRYSDEMRFGVPYYRAKVITAWDTLRDFDSK